MKGVGTKAVSKGLQTLRNSGANAKRYSTDRGRTRTKSVYHSRLPRDEMTKVPSQMLPVLLWVLVRAAVIIMLPFGSGHSADAQGAQYAQTGPTSEGLTAVAQYFQDSRYP